MPDKFKVTVQKGMFFWSWKVERQTNQRPNPFGGSRGDELRGTSWTEKSALKSARGAVKKRKKADAKYAEKIRRRTETTTTEII